MSGTPNSTRQTERRKETIAEIVEAAWEVVRESGLAGMSMRDLGDRVGMKAQSIYSYFDSKNEIYDAMFLVGYQSFISSMDFASDGGQPADNPAEVLRASAHRFVEFCTSDPVRYQLLFQRTIPGFEPSPQSWAVAVEAYDQARQQLADVGLADQETVDLWTAILTGLTDQQISNDPGGDRWEKLIDRAVDMLFADAQTRNENEES